MGHENSAQPPTAEEIEALARTRAPHVWLLDPPDFSLAQYRHVSMEHAEDALLEQHGLPSVRAYE